MRSLSFCCRLQKVKTQAGYLAVSASRSWCRSWRLRGAADRRSFPFYNLLVALGFIISIISSWPIDSGNIGKQQLRHQALILHNQLCLLFDSVHFRVFFWCRNLTNMRSFFCKRKSSNPRREIGEPFFQNLEILVLNLENWGNKLVTLIVEPWICWATHQCIGCWCCLCQAWPNAQSISAMPFLGHKCRGCWCFLCQAWPNVQSMSAMPFCGNRWCEWLNQL